MQVNGREINKENSPYIIAEVGSGHLRTLESCLNLIELAKIAGVDAVKIQTYSPDSLTIDCPGRAFTVEDGPWRGRNLYELYKLGQTPKAWHPRLFERAEKLGVTLFSTPFSPEDVDFLEEIGCPAYKIASPEITHMELIRRVVKTGKPIFLSTGMANLYEVDDAIEASGTRPLVIMHCVSGYPTPTERANLSGIGRLNNFAAGERMVGFSDHTRGHIAAVAAVALGAVAIEKHIGYSESLDGCFATRPEEFASFVTAVRLGWEALQPRCNIKSELPTMRLRRSIYVVENMDAGDVFTPYNLRVIRPGSGMHPNMLGRVLGKMASRDLKRGHPLCPSDFE